MTREERAAKLTEVLLNGPTVGLPVMFVPVNPPKGRRHFGTIVAIRSDVIKVAWAADNRPAFTGDPDPGNVDGFVPQAWLKTLFPRGLRGVKSELVDWNGWTSSGYE